MGTIILIIEMDIEIGPVFKAKILSEIGKMVIMDHYRHLTTTRGPKSMIPSKFTTLKMIHERVKKIFELLDPKTLEHLNDEEIQHIKDLISESPYTFGLPGEPLKTTNVITHKIETTSDISHSTIEDVEFDFEENDCEMLAPRTSSVHQFERAENYEKNDDELCVLLQDDPIPESFESYLKNDLSGSTSSVSNGDGRYEDIIDEK
ncbi:hypothetical protein TKK_0017140 [Trichogramma kaykai]